MNLIDKVKERIRNEAKNSKDEICGFILEKDGTPRIFSCQNSALNPHSLFKISAREFLMAENFGNIVAVYHSQFEKDELSESDIKNRDHHNLPYVLYCLRTNNFSISYPGQSKSKYDIYLGRIFDLGKCDCFSLVRDFYLTELKIDIPDFYRQNLWYEEDPIRIEKEARNLGFTLLSPTSKLEKHDILIFSCESRKYPRHFGIYLDGREFLHHPRNDFSRIDNLDTTTLHLLYIARNG